MTMGWWNWFPCLSFDFAINQHHEQWACSSLRFSDLLKDSVLMAHNTLLVGNEPTSFQLPALSLKHHTPNKVALLHHMPYTETSAVTQGQDAQV